VTGCKLFIEFNYIHYNMYVMCFQKLQFPVTLPCLECYKVA
jgi:hypothetical protein